MEDAETTTHRCGPCHVSKRLIVVFGYLGALQIQGVFPFQN